MASQQSPVNNFCAKLTKNFMLSGDKASEDFTATGDTRIQRDTIFPVAITALPGLVADSNKRLEAKRSSYVVHQTNKELEEYGVVYLFPSPLLTTIGSNIEVRTTLSSPLTSSMGPMMWNFSIAMLK